MAGVALAMLNYVAAVVAPQGLSVGVTTRVGGAFDDEEATLPLRCLAEA
jgi:hypothetical protein